MPDEGQSPAFLDVEHSLTKRAWRLRESLPSVVQRHQIEAGLSQPIAQMLAGRGVMPGEAQGFLHPTLKATFPDPSSFADMDKAAKILVDAVVSGRPTTIFADYDVDGATSAALLVRWFRAMGRDLPVYIPDREREGYGPSVPAFESIRQSGTELVVTLDCGAAAQDALVAARDMGLDVVVIDHHLMAGAMPPAVALVNPNRPDCHSGQGNLAAAGVAFVLLAALNREARGRGLCDARSQPDLTQWSDLAALGAICDVTQLTGFNRALTVHGLRQMSNWSNPGLKALLEVSKASGAASTYMAGFVLGPRINAGGRIGRADLGAQLLSSDDPELVAEIAVQLDQLNGERRQIEAETFEEALSRIAASNQPDDDPVLVVSSEGWRSGIIGIVAGRLKERLRRASVVIGIDPVSGIAKGSGRSVPGLNLGQVIHQAVEAGFCLSGGGHAMAAGLTAHRSQIPDLTQFINASLRAGHAGLEPDVLDIDCLVASAGLNRELYNDIQAMAPFGPGNAEPLLALADMRLERSILMKGGHIRTTLVDPNGRKFKALAWRSADTALGNRLLEEGGPVHVVGRLKPDDWQGRENVELEIEDLADPRRMSPRN
jgi:single-stranded-DNA-specific exonuclease